MIREASGRISSSSTTSANGVTSCPVSVAVRFGVCAIKTTRCPNAASGASFAATSASCGANTSGAPMAYAPCAPNDAPAHLRAEEKGTISSAAQCDGAGNCEATARSVAFGFESTAPKAPRAASTSFSSARSNSSRCESTTRPVVRVPVLSRQSTDTRARSSTEASSRESTFWRANAITPARKARLVNSTKPSGTIATAAATVPRSASRHPGSEFIRRQNRTNDTGGMMNTSTRRTRFTPRRSSESIWVN